MIQLITGCMAFHSAFFKTKLKFKMWFLLDLSIKFWFQALLGRGNESRTWRNQMALELWCQDSSNFSKIQEQAFHLRRTVYLKRKLGITVRWTGASRSTVQWGFIWSKRCDSVASVRSLMEGWDLSTFCVWRGASFHLVRRIFIGRSWFNRRSTDRNESQSL